MKNLLERDITDIIGSERDYSEIISKRSASFKALSDDCGPTMAARILETDKLLLAVHEAAKGHCELRRCYNEIRPRTLEDFADQARTLLIESWEEGGVLNSESEAALSQASGLLVEYDSSKHSEFSEWFSKKTEQLDEFDAQKLKLNAYLLTQGIQTKKAKYAIADDIFGFGILLESILYNGIVAGYDSARAQNALKESFEKILKASLGIEALDALGDLIDALSPIKDLDETMKLAKGSQDLERVLIEFDARIAAWVEAVRILTEIIVKIEALPSKD